MITAPEANDSSFDLLGDEMKQNLSASDIVGQIHILKEFILAGSAEFSRAELAQIDRATMKMLVATNMVLKKMKVDQKSAPV